MTDIIDQCIVPPIKLKGGGHPTRDQGTCLMEAVAWVAGEPHSDHPECACKILSGYARILNDGRWSSDKARTEALSPLIPLLLNTRTDDVTIMRRRAWALADGAIRKILPMVCELRGDAGLAAELRVLEVVSEKTYERAVELARRVQQKYADAADDAAAYAANAANAYSAANAAAYADAILQAGADVLRDAIIATTAREVGDGDQVHRASDLSVDEFMSSLNVEHVVKVTHGCK